MTLAHRFARLVTIALAIGLGLGLSFASPVRANTTSGTMNISATVTSACTVTNTPAVAFGSFSGLMAAAVDASGSIQIQCTNGSGYTVALNSGSYSSGGLPNRRMISSVQHSSAFQYVSYQLSQSSCSATCPTIWGDGTGSTNTLSSTGTGSIQTFTIFGAITVQSLYPDSYNDTVTITVTY